MNHQFYEWSWLSDPSLIFSMLIKFTQWGRLVPVWIYGVCPLKGPHLWTMPLLPFIGYVTLLLLHSLCSSYDSAFFPLALIKWPNLSVHRETLKPSDESPLIFTIQRIQNLYTHISFFYGIKGDGWFHYQCQRSQYSVPRWTQMLGRDFGLKGESRISKHQIKAVLLRNKTILIGSSELFLEYSREYTWDIHYKCFHLVFTKYRKSAFTGRSFSTFLH